MNVNVIRLIIFSFTADGCFFAPKMFFPVKKHREAFSELLVASYFLAWVRGTKPGSLYEILWSGTIIMCTFKMHIVINKRFV